MSAVDISLFVFSLTLIIYILVKNRLQYWAKRRVPYLHQKTPKKTGKNMENSSSSVVEHYEKIYFDLAPHKYGGYLNKFLSPVLLIRDPEYIKNILTKDFNHFINRDFDFTNENRALFNLTDERWKVIRTKLSPFFTPGKLKIMFSMMKECGKELIEVIDAMNQRNEPIDVKDLMSRFTIDGICVCALGLKSNSLRNPGSIFQAMGKKIFLMALHNNTTEFFSAVAPKLESFLTQTFTDKSVKKFFEKVVTDTIKYREENNIHQNDFIDTLVALRQEVKSKDWSQKRNAVLTEELIIAQGFTFFAAGYETSSRALYLGLYEIAKNDAIKNKLDEEISSVISKYKGELTFECLQDMTYLDQVVNETLRLYPIMSILTRICNKSYQLDENFTIEEGTRIKIPVKGIHSDPKYYKNPNEFNPENFSKEAKAERHQYAFLPFGHGPRMCIGMRFGLMQVKFGIAALMNSYEISLLPESKGSLKFNEKAFTLAIEDGIWLKLSKKIQEQN